MDKLEKMNFILSDKTKFQSIPQEKDRTIKLEQELSSSLRILKDEKFISPDVYEKLRPSGSSIPRLYGLPKVHKTGVRFWICPIPRII